MNIFVLDKNPETAAIMHCDKHVPKMCVEAAQMMASALRRHGATDEQMPLTKSGTPYKGGYAYHPCTVWAGDSEANFIWLARHAIELCVQYENRFGKVHACRDPIHSMIGLIPLFTDKYPSPKAALTPFAQAMPDKYRDDDVVKAYRAYYHSKQFATWDKGILAPSWWRGVEVIR
jgi:hypothetical protein|tara:strand:+ start:2434 stop:2958 length:525 start_codon:yes stop_codon:yes gene_type:complete